MILGLLLNYVATTFFMLLVSRLVYGIGFGLSIPFIGSAIMNFYQGAKRDMMNTINSLFPFFGTFISFSLVVPLYHFLGDSWQNALGIWFLLLGIILALWIFFIREKDIQKATILQPNKEEQKKEKNIYGNLLRRKTIVLLSLIFICDHFVYSYVVTILPTFLFESTTMDEATASLLAAFAFPACGLLGTILGGWLMSYSGLKKPVVLIGVISKLIEIILTGPLTQHSIVLTIIGFCLFGFGNGCRLPVFYAMPMDLPKMTPLRVGAAFALMTSCGFAVGMISPIIGGWLTDMFSAASSLTDIAAAHVHGFRWSLLVFCLVNVCEVICGFCLKETGTKKIHG